MAKKPEQPPPPEAEGNGHGQPDSSENENQPAEPSPEIEAAEATVRRAKVELKKAEDLYQHVRQQAADRLKQIREKTVADVVDGTLKTVKRHPGPSVIVAALIGFFLGRLFRR